MGHKPLGAPRQLQGYIGLNPSRYGERRGGTGMYLVNSIVCLTGQPVRRVIIRSESCRKDDAYEYV